MQCAHDACFCEAPAGQRYCGEYCRKISEGDPEGDIHEELVEDDEDFLCECGHPECDNLEDEA